ncbi:phytoene/squalene synthase family protein [Candidatus Woesebacteria bacterium]|nr:phytoene/squalene synthase family protein [Candidatus Woesebacteria bacterium]
MAAAKKWSTTLFKKASVTYYTASLFFPKQSREAVTILYAFVRTVDDFIDTQSQNALGYYAFVAEYRHALHVNKRSENQIIAEFILLQQKFQFKQVWIDAFLKAMELDLYKHQYRTLEELEHYMYGSAEVIGLMLCRIFEVSEKLYPAARMLGKTMQYINFLRDVAEDYGLERQYLPSEICDACGVYSLQKPKDSVEEACFSKLLTQELGRYKLWSNSASQGIARLPKQYRVPVRTAARMYDWTAKRILQNPMIVWQKKVKPHPLRVIFQALLLQ